jgi:hypothetical protein
MALVVALAAGLAVMGISGLAKCLRNLDGMAIAKNATLFLDAQSSIHSTQFVHVGCHGCMNAQ